MLFLSANSANSNRKKNPKCFRTSDQLAFFALYFSFAFISFAGFTADLASADDHPVDEEFTPPPPPILVSDSNRGFHIGDTCLDGCSNVIGNSYCNTTTNTCECLRTHPINIEGVDCVQSKNLYESCTYNQQCISRNPKSFCQELPSKQTQCSCRKGYSAQKSHDIYADLRYECGIDSLGPLAETTVPAIVGLFIGLTILLFLFCFMFKLFTQSRWARARAYADAGQPPPTITLEDEQIDLEKQELFRKSSGDRNKITGSPASSVGRSDNSDRHISSNYSSRRGSGNNNSEKDGHNSRRGSSRRSSSESSHSRRASLTQRNGAVLAATDPLAFNDLDPKGAEDCDIEQHITIIPNPRAKRRGSMADHAFPELHGSRAGKKAREPENLLILTRTTTDRHGRRHSVAVPLIPPPDGEKFEGGYSVERNPITGGAKLVPPTGGKLGRTRSISERRGSKGQKATPTSSKTSKEQQPPLTVAAAAKGSNGKPGQKDANLLSIPGKSARNSRRHSYQAGVPGLAKEMDRLKVGSTTGSSPAGSSRGASPRSSTKRRPSVRRSSRSGFLHFLDLAIAN